MEQQDRNMYHSIQKSAERMKKAMDTLADKVYDRDLAMQMSRHALELSQIQNEAARELISSKEENYKSNHLEEMVQRSVLQYNTLLNISTGHIAELLIESTTKGILEMEKVLRHHPDACGQPKELARKMQEMGERNVQALKEYL